MFVDLKPIWSVWNLGLYRLCKTVKSVSMDNFGDKSNFQLFKNIRQFEWNELVKTDKFDLDIQVLREKE